jgi:fatty acid desaturase
MFAGLALLLALAATFGGSARSTVVWWVLVAFWVFMLAWAPRKRALMLSRALYAEEDARRALRRQLYREQL